jgi:hypothetical protein
MEAVTTRLCDGVLPEVRIRQWTVSFPFALRRLLAACSSEELQQRLAEAFVAQGIEYAATGIGAAWVLTGFASFRLVTICWRKPPGGSLVVHLTTDPTGGRLES